MVNTFLLAGIGLWLAFSIIGFAVLGYLHRSSPSDDSQWRYPVESLDD